MTGEQRGWGGGTTNGLWAELHSAKPPASIAVQPDSLTTPLPCSLLLPNPCSLLLLPTAGTWPSGRRTCGPGATVLKTAARCAPLVYTSCLPTALAGMAAARLFGWPRAADRTCIHPALPRCCRPSAGSRRWSAATRRWLWRRPPTQCLATRYSSGKRCCACFAAPVAGHAVLGVHPMPRLIALVFHLPNTCCAALVCAALLAGCRRGAAYHGLGRLQEALRDYEAAEVAAEAEGFDKAKKQIAK